jgi:folylpolyglutamate synthase/dihydropteroate synthase
MSADKDIAGCLTSLVSLVDDIDQIHCVAARHPRAISPSGLRSLLEQVVHTSKQSSVTINNVTLTNQTNSSDHFKNNVLNRSSLIRLEVHNAMLAAAKSSLNTQKAPVILICGSAFIMSEARAELGYNEPKDGDILYDAMIAEIDKNSQLSEFPDAQVKS